MTGLGLVTPLGVGVSRVWKKLLDGESGIRRIESTDKLDYSSLPCQVHTTDCGNTMWSWYLYFVEACMVILFAIQ